MINAFLTGIINLISDLVNVILLPIDILINNYLPNLSVVIDTVSDFFQWICGFIPYICSWLNLPSWFISFVITAFTFKLTVPLLVHTVKLGISWYDKLKP